MAGTFGITCFAGVLAPLFASADGGAEPAALAHDGPPSVAMLEAGAPLFDEFADARAGLAVEDDSFALAEVNLTGL